MQIEDALGDRQPEAGAGTAALRAVATVFRALARHAGWAHGEFWMDSSSAYVLHQLEYLG